MAKPGCMPAQHPGFRRTLEENCTADDNQEDEQYEDRPRAGPCRAYTATYRCCHEVSLLSVMLPCPISYGGEDSCAWTFAPYRLQMGGSGRSEHDDSQNALCYDQIKYINIQVAKHAPFS